MRITSQTSRRDHQNHSGGMGYLHHGEGNFPTINYAYTLKGKPYEDKTDRLQDRLRLADGCQWVREVSFLRSN